LLSSKAFVAAHDIVRGSKSGINQSVGKHKSGSSGPSGMMVWPDKMALLTLGGGNGAVIENGWQDQRGKDAEGKLGKGPQSKDTVPKRFKQ
jgi:hypothetical protein